MPNWGEEFDDELKNYDRPKAHFSLNFRYITHMLDRIDEETRDWNEKYPKSELMKLWGSVMALYFILVCLTYSVLIIVTGAFYVFNTYALFQLYGKWKRFKYSKGSFLLMTAIAMVIVFVAGGFVRGMLFG